MTPVIISIHRYPVKGLSAQALGAVVLTPGEALPFDRAYAIENGSGAFDPSTPRHLPKIAFLCQMRDERLAHLQTLFDDASALLIILRDGIEVARGCLLTVDGRAAIEAFFSREFAPELRGAPRVVYASGHSFSDVKETCVHVINMASVRALEAIIKTKIDPLRFRANVIVDGLEAWTELGWVNREIRLGSARLAVFKRTVRCAATNVNPVTAQRDLALPDSLMQQLGHRDFGVYATVVEGALVQIGDDVLA